MTVQTPDWHEIRARLSRRAASSDGDFLEAIRGLLQIAEAVASDRVACPLFGWLSMNDLCIQQTDCPPLSCPYLRISPQGDGTLVFRYVDTMIVSRQWQRQIPAVEALRRLGHFMEQLHWCAPPALSGAVGNH